MKVCSLISASGLLYNLILITYIPMCVLDQTEPCSQSVLYHFSTKGTKAITWDLPALKSDYSCPFLMEMMRKQRKEQWVRVLWFLAVPQRQREAGEVRSKDKWDVQGCVSS